MLSWKRETGLFCIRPVEVDLESHKKQWYLNSTNNRTRMTEAIAVSEGGNLNPVHKKNRAVFVQKVADLIHTDGIGNPVVDAGAGVYVDLSFIGDVGVVVVFSVPSFGDQVAFPL